MLSLFRVGYVNSWNGSLVNIEIWNYVGMF